VSRSLASLAAVLASVMAVPAIGQQVAPAEPPQRPERPVDPRAKAQADAILERAYAAHDSGRYAEAVQLYDQAYAVNPDIGTLLVRGSAKVGLDDCAGALADFALVEEELIFSDFIAGTDLYRDRAVCNMTLRDYDAVVTDLINQTNQVPDDSWSWMTLGRAWGQTGQPAEAEAALKRAIKLAPEDSDPAYYLAIQYIVDRRPTEALPYLQTAVRLEPGNAEKRSLLDTLERELAEANAPSSARANPGPSTATAPAASRTSAAAAPIGYPPIDPRSALGRGIALYLDGEYQQALPVLSEATQAAPNDARGFAFLGAAYYILGLQRESDAARERALALDPGVLRMVPPP